MNKDTDPTPAPPLEGRGVASPTPPKEGLAERRKRG